MKVLVSLLVLSSMLYSTSKAEQPTRPNTLELSCKRVLYIGGGIFVERCENKEVICYVMREAISCKFK